MNEKIDKTLKKIAGDISKENTHTSSRTVRTKKALSEGAFIPEYRSDLLGDPNCPICQGLGYFRVEVPVGHPAFGRLQLCSCRSKEISQQVKERLFALSNLESLSHLTFENFEPQGRMGLLPRQATSLAIAYESCQRFAQTLEGWILLQGSFGCGKTHLAAAIANYAVSMGAPTLFLTVPDLLDTLRFAFSSNEISFEERFEQIRSSALLILDDFGTQNATEWAQEKIFQIINFRYINHLPMVITTNLPQDDIDGRIRSRLDDPDLVQKIKIDAPDYRNPTGDMGQSHLSSLHIHNTKTFEMFSLRQEEGLVEGEAKQLQLAFRAAQEFAKKPKGWLVFIGSFGSGKTHLAAAIAQYLEGTGPEPLFISIPDFLDHLRSTFSPSSTVSFDREFDRALYAPVLIMDDLTTQAMTPWVKTKLHQLILTRFDHELPTVITTSDSLEQMDPRIFSRLRNSTLCTIYAITVPPYSGKASKTPARKSTPTTKRKT